MVWYGKGEFQSRVDRRKARPAEVAQTANPIPLRLAVDYDASEIVYIP